ncbi:protein kinase [Vitiosangium sp. GDMCC 1.1324]|uniref:protein kinase domain-containing protein n=1 Tax=Vitiosangium sp. (strain GDMCC 1.1324) TaxID=2138576 RepID=UPI000D383703|nr:protein kinase [Vitiosangium sp. GDMCC 1.1324]PTL77497.1 serine/threonine protein kinase [Vitiosangium sp. GDMCC 1.1324]
MNPQLFGKYQLIKKLATGGMAEVWLARQKGIEGFAKNVVVKRILPHLAEDGEFVEMFRNEALIAAKFNHPNIAQVYEFGEANGTYFIAMEFIHGEDLGRVMRKAYNAGGWIARPLAIRMVASACEGLYYAHTRTDDSGRPLKVVHRDISPQNILISFDGSVKLVDFGIAKAADQASLTKSGAIKGKFAYMAPEQAAGKALDSRADIFAIGLVLYELLTGTRPLKRESELGTLQAALECNILPPSQVAEVPEELDSVVMRALAKAADDRYRDARQLQLALEEFLVSQRWVAGSVQISELMETLFADRLDEEKRSGNPEPRSEESMSAMPVAPEPPPEEPPPPQRSSSRVEPRAASNQTSTSAVDMSWEAPPGEMPNQRRTGTRAGVVNKRTESATLPMTSDTPEVEEWEAPPATEVPRRRTSNEAPRRTNVGATSVARTPSRVEVSRGTNTEAPVPRRTGTESPAMRRSGTRAGEPAADAEVPQPRLTRGAAAANPRPRPIEEDEDPERTMLPPPPEPAEPPRRRTGVAASAQQQQTEQPPRRRTTSRAEMPEPPVAPRRRTSMVGAADELEDEDVSAPGARAKPAAAKGRALPPLKNLLGAFVALAVVGLAVIFRHQLLDILGSSAMDGQGIYLNVTSNQRVQVSVRHSARCRSSEPITVLGYTPLQRMGGAHVQDTLILENKEQGIHDEIEVPFGEPQETKTIERNFQMGYFRPKLVPRNVSGIEIYRDGQKLALYQPGLKVELVEGTHHLVFQSGSLKEPVMVDVEVKARDITDKTVDLSSYLR